MSSEFHFRKAPVIDLFTGQTLESGEDRRIVRLSPEHDGLSMLYCNDANPGKTFKLKIIAWGLQRNGKVVGLVPWLNCVTSCQDLSDPLNGRWEGYFNASNGQIFFEPPAHKSMELEAAHNFYKQNSLASRSEEVLQEIPDNIGTHAVFADKASKDFHINAIFSWQLYGNGRIEGMLIDAEKIRQTPVLAGDQALYPAHEDPNFRYFFQFHKSMELEAAHNFYKQNSLASRSEEVLQEIPDNIGTHAVFADKASKDFHINAIFSWQLYGNGRIEGMLIDAEKIRQTPVLAGDQALYPAHEDPNFRYFFQYGIANKIKTNDPEALKAISLMIKL